jgi:hypothetical protein
VEPNKESTLPGMVGQPVLVSNGTSVADEFVWGGGEDSFYEVISLH